MRRILVVMVMVVMVVVMVVVVMVVMVMVVVMVVMVMVVMVVVMVVMVVVVVVLGMQCEPGAVGGCGSSRLVYRPSVRRHQTQWSSERPLPTAQYP